jgi:predicted MPP superfamily phosphohydrolase
MYRKQWVERLWDAWCIVSIVGIWPRFVEPQLLSTTQLVLPIPQLPQSLEGTKIIQLSDLHWAKGFPQGLIDKIKDKINRFNPDIIVFTGDFLTRSRLENEEQLMELLNSLKASTGCFAILGNHDYSKFVTLNRDGDYDIDRASSQSSISKGFSRLLTSTSTATGNITPEAKQVGMHHELLALLKKTSFTLLDNDSQLIPCRGSYLNVCGLGEYALGRCNPEKAFRNYDPKYPGVILSHNPDSFPFLQDYPGELILAGHTHGGQINIPLLWNKFTKMKDKKYKRGLKKLKDKWVYINRGVSSVMKFRLFSIPEITCITLRRGSHANTHSV